MRTQVIIHPDPEPTMKDIRVDRELLTNPNLSSQKLKEKFFFSKIPSARKSPTK